MEEIFIQNIRINHIRNISDFEIPISETEKKHLIITGKNGSGKTTLLKELKYFLENVVNTNYQDKRERLKNLVTYIETLVSNVERKHSFRFKNIEVEHPDLLLRENPDYYKIKEEQKQIVAWLYQFNNVNIVINKNDLAAKQFGKGTYIIAFFEAKRLNNLIQPTEIKLVNIKPFYGIEDIAGKDFIQYIIKLKTDYIFAKNENDNVEADKIDKWFQQFEARILDLLDIKDAELQFDRKTLNFNIIEPGKSPYNLNQLSDGYTAIFNIITELIMRMEEHKTKNYDVQGIVLIDEIETHLHIELQKKVLPFLISFFPKVQFIVTTHSPFVITSVENAVVCDLEKKMVFSDLSEYSYDAIVKGYFDNYKYSNVLKRKVDEYEKLMGKETLTDEEQDRLDELNLDFEHIPKIFADELVVKLQQIKLKNIKRKVRK